MLCLVKLSIVKVKITILTAFGLYFSVAQLVILVWTFAFDCFPACSRVVLSTWNVTSQDVKIELSQDSTATCLLFEI